MKQSITILSVILCFFTFAWGQQTTTITGTVTNPTSEEVSFSYAKDMLGMDRATHNAELGENGEFSIELDMEAAAYVRVGHGSERSSIYIEPGATLTMSLDAEEFDESMKFEGEGSAPAQYMLKHFLTFEDGEARDNYYDKLRNATPEEFTDFEAERMKAQMELLAEHASNLPSDFVKDQERTFLYEKGDQMLYFSTFYRYRAEQSMKQEDTEALPPLSDEYFGFMTDIPINDDAAVENSAYQKYLGSYLDYKQTELIAEYPENGYDYATRWNKDGLTLMSILLTGKSYDVMLAQKIHSFFREGNAVPVIDQYEMFLEEKGETYPTIAAALTKGYEKAKALMPGQPAPALTLMNIDGEEVSLSDFEGKVVYVDFWASWCGPCLMEVPYAKKLQEQMKEEKDLVFLYISIDDTEEPWKKAVADKGLKGTHLISKTWRGEAPTKYSVHGIPRYYLINRDGTIANNNAPRPSSGEILVNEIQAALTGSKSVQGGGSK